jgi:hypothetical protein
LPKCCIRVCDPRLIECRLHLDDRGLFRLQYRVEPAQNGHRQDHIPVLAADVEIAQHIVGDAPDKIRDPAEVTVAHAVLLPPCAMSISRANA